MKKINQLQETVLLNQDWKNPKSLKKKCAHFGYMKLPTKIFHKRSQEANSRFGKTFSNTKDGYLTLKQFL